MKLNQLALSKAKGLSDPLQADQISLSEAHLRTASEWLNRNDSREGAKDARFGTIVNVFLRGLGVLARVNSSNVSIRNRREY
jgi:hypothetical protein